MSPPNEALVGGTNEIASFTYEGMNFRDCSFSSDSLPLREVPLPSCGRELRHDPRRASRSFSIAPSIISLVCVDSTSQTPYLLTIDKIETRSLTMSSQLRVLYRDVYLSRNISYPANNTTSTSWTGAGSYSGNAYYNSQTQSGKDPTTLVLFILFIGFT